MRAKVQRHVHTQRGLGRSLPGIVLSLPLDAFRYRRRSSLAGGQIEGYGRYDLPLLASYSRSGTNWIRYITEWISQRPTPGQVRIHAGTDFVLDRAHRAYPVMSRHPGVLLVLRDYRECLLRQNPEVWAEAGSVVEFLETTDAKQPPSWYIRNVEAFDQFSGAKMLLHYEDLVSNPPAAIRTIASFLELDRGRADRFVAEVSMHYARSVGLYRGGGHASVTSGSADPHFHARRLLTEGQAEEFDDYYETTYPDLFARYLARYRFTG